MNGVPYSLLFGPFTLAFPQRVLYRDGLALRLGSRAIGILVALAEAPGELLSQDTLIAMVWPDSVVDEGALRVHLSAVRKALGDGRDGVQYINNEPGRGYRFVAPLRRIDSGNTLADSARVDANTSNVPVPMPPHNLPGQVTRILGRDDIVSQLLAQLVAQRCLTISGLGGIGKTSVALAIAHRYAAGGIGPVAYLDFAPLCDADCISDALAVALGIVTDHQASASRGTHRDALQPVIARLGNATALLLLDNCEHLVDTLTPLVERLLHEAPNVRLLLTSREPLRAESESVHRLATLASPKAGETLTPAQARDYAAVCLFVERATEVRENFSLDSANVDAVCEICRSLDGIPLAIELAAARADWLDAPGIAARLDERFKLLTKGRRTALPRQQTLRATLDWSYDLLTPQSQAVLRRVALLSNGFDMASMLAVASGDGVLAASVLDAAADLVAKSLLNCEMTGGEAQFHLLHTTRHYALDRLAESDDEEATRRRHAYAMRDRAASLA